MNGVFLVEKPIIVVVRIGDLVLCIGLYLIIV